MNINRVKVPKKLVLPLQILLMTGEVYPNYYIGKGGRSKCGPDVATRLEEFLTASAKLKPHHIEHGNAAPRRGHVGQYVRLTTAGKKLKVIKEALAQRKIDAIREEEDKLAEQRAISERYSKAEKAFNAAGGMPAALEWFGNLPTKEREKIRGYRTGFTCPPFNARMQSRIRHAFKRSVSE